MNCLMKNPFCLHRSTYIFCCCCSWEFTFLEFLWQASLRLAPLRFSDFSCGLLHYPPRGKSLDGAGCMCRVAKFCLTLCDPMDCSLPCSSVHGISQARVLNYHFLLQGLFLTQVNLWVEKIPWRREWQPLQYSCLGNPMDRGAWQATVYEITKSET